MAKYLIAASYSPDGLKGLRKDKASGRKKAIEEAYASIGGRLEVLYFALGEYELYAIADFPDMVSAAAVGLAASETGLARTRTIPLLTVEETDRAIEKVVKYRGPGR